MPIRQPELRLLLLVASILLAGCATTGSTTTTTPEASGTPAAVRVETVGEPNTHFEIAPGKTHEESFTLAPDLSATAILDLRTTEGNSVMGCIFDEEQYERFDDRRSYTGFACVKGNPGGSAEGQIAAGPEFPGTWFYLGIRCTDDRYACAGAFTLRLATTSP